MHKDVYRIRPWFALCKDNNCCSARRCRFLSHWGKNKNTQNKCQITNLTLLGWIFNHIQCILTQFLSFCLIPYNFLSIGCYIFVDLLSKLPEINTLLIWFEEEIYWWDENNSTFISMFENQLCLYMYKLYFGCGIASFGQMVYVFNQLSVQFM